jgi:hypothetical protein
LRLPERFHRTGIAEFSQYFRCADPAHLVWVVQAANEGFDCPTVVYAAECGDGTGTDVRFRVQKERDECRDG